MLESVNYIRRAAIRVVNNFSLQSQYISMQRGNENKKIISQGIVLMRYQILETVHKRNV